MEDDLATASAIIGFALFLLSETLPLLRGVKANGLMHGIRCAMESECVNHPEEIPMAEEAPAGGNLENY